MWASKVIVRLKKNAAFKKFHQNNLGIFIVTDVKIKEKKSRTELKAWEY